MKYAYDTYLQTVVDAYDAYASRAEEPYRFECACCGEEVYLAAKDSLHIATHFRHLSGNNDTECENYLGRFGLIRTSLSQSRSARERIDFYYSNNTKCFYIGIKLTEDEIYQYEKSNTYFEVRAQKNEKPFISTCISQLAFSPEISERIPINTYATDYYVSNTFSNKKRPYSVFHANSPSFFKILGDSEDKSFWAKLIRSNVLYTKEQYLVVLPGSNAALIHLNKFQNIIDIVEQFEFKTMGWRTWAVIVSFREKNQELSTLLSNWGYSLDSNEEITLLWPPCYEENDTSVIFDNSLYVYSTFILTGNGNINISSSSMEKIDNNITKLTISDKKIKAIKKNAELSVEKKPILGTKNDVISHLSIEEREYTIPSHGRFFLFDSYGVIRCCEGQHIILTDNAKLVELNNNQIISIRTAPSINDLQGEFLLSDILANNKEQTPLKESNIHSSNPTVQNYINECTVSGLINPIVYKAIKEGRL